MQSTESQAKPNMADSDSSYRDLTRKAEENLLELRSEQHHSARQSKKSRLISQGQSTEIPTTMAVGSTTDHFITPGTDMHLEKSYTRRTGFGKHPSSMPHKDPESGVLLWAVISFSALSLYSWIFSQNPSSLPVLEPYNPDVPNKISPSLKIQNV